MKLYPTVLIPDLEDGLFTPVENVYLLTTDEIKKIVSDTFDAGTFYEYARMEENIRGTKNIFSNKEAYLNNLKID